MISVFIPCYNEERRLENNIIKIYTTFQSLKVPFELFIVDDNSSDLTSTVGKTLEQKYAHIHYIHFSQGPSRRENLAKAFRSAHGDILLFMDLDLSVDLSYVPLLLEYVSTYDIAIGSRYMGKKAHRTLGRLVISTIYNTFMRLYFHSHIQDHQCGFKAFKKEKILSLLDDMGYDSSFKRGWFWDVELLIRAQRKGYSIKEFAVDWNEGKQSTFDIKRELTMLPYVIRLRFRL